MMLGHRRNQTACNMVVPLPPHPVNDSAIGRRCFFLASLIVLGSIPIAICVCLLLFASPSLSVFLSLSLRFSVCLSLSLSLSISLSLCPSRPPSVSLSRSLPAFFSPGDRENTTLPDMDARRVAALRRIVPGCFLCHADAHDIDCLTISTPRGFEPLRAEPNGFRVHLLSHSDTVSCHIAAPKNTMADGMP